MAKPLSCPGCEAEYDAAGYDPGDQFECPACKEIVTVGGGAPASSAPRTAKMPSRGGTTRRTASRPPAAPRDRTTSKMRVVNQAVGMGALDPNIDPKMIRRAGAQPQAPVSTGGDKTPMVIAAVIAAVVILGGVIYIAKQPSHDEKKATAAKDKKKTEDDAKPVVAKPADSDPLKPRAMDVPGVTKQIQDHVSQTLSLLKTQPINPNFWKVAAPLLQYGAPAIGELIEHFNAGTQEEALAARAIVAKATGWSIPEEPFYSAASRERIKGDVYASWQDKVNAGTFKIKSEAEFLADDGAVAVNPPPTDPPPDNPNGNPTPPPDGVVPKRPVGGGTGEAAMRRDLPQYIANYATGTGDQQDEAIREVRKFGKAVIPALIASLKEEDTSRARASYSMLKEFTKQEFGVIPGDVQDRTEFLQKWADWWKANEATFNM